MGLAWGEAASRWELDRGINKLHPDSWRFTLGKPQLYQWPLTDEWRIELDLEANLYHWDDPFRDRSISVISAVPLFKAITSSEDLDYYLGLGIGVAAMDSDIWMDRQLGSHLQFEDRVELGLRYYRHQFSLGLSHFSNADIADINHGVNVYQIGYSYFF
ncbi:acyloxyacyl hydrolase [Alteromonas sp. ASW11-36]|uniref:Acyloxyacyl hydrolase n=1 Tax=Alteromonas arenosi TaxID=3055817 RepID=A0ABT7SZN3_9ALTE|nr:acyloxyacyl hydrolase [Alteromonas sp. ASW11-36]MDM7861652.1 acyloxyacyl hydrolase [Alteromonas sp. ASW11-36]